ncbi:peptidase family M48-domain-containing protein [Lenzites betulinus]|nr:peptidase family M48-domain-containing protein [Lenzites betulinus]
MLSSFARLARCARLPTPPRPLAQLARPRSLPARTYSSAPRGPQRYVRFGESGGPGGGAPRNPWDVRNWDRTATVIAGVGSFVLVYYLSHLEQVPETGRWRFMDISPKYEAMLAETAHEQLMKEFKGKVLPPNHPLSRHIRRVVERILEANGLGTLQAPGVTDSQVRPSAEVWSAVDPDRMPPESGGKQWHLFVVNDDKMVNAMASFGNIVVFTGILPVAKDENGLAGILGHEIGHAVARHASESYSGMKVFLFLAAVLEVVGIPFSSIVTQLLYDLPNSRTMEYEADKIGLRLAARACFDPEGVPQAFSRLAQLERAMGGMHIDFLTTHPASDKRSKVLREMLPEAYAAQAASPMCGQTADHMAQFRDTWMGGLDPDRMSEARWT